MTIAFPLDESRATTAPSEILNPNSQIPNPREDFPPRSQSEISNPKSEIPKPLSKKRLAANRANAAKSTGPKTPKGKQPPAQNPLKHGLRSAISFQTPPPKTPLCHEESNHPA